MSQDVQTRLETLFLTSKALEQEVKRLRGTQPVICILPPRPMLVSRLILYALPWLRRRRERRILRGCGLFDPVWYRARYSDVQAEGVDPARHFLETGAAEQRDPGPHFSTAHYLHLYPDIREAGLNPLLHYLASGWREGRSIRPGMPHDSSGEGRG